jgi:hypothetical protein
LKNTFVAVGRLIVVESMVEVLLTRVSLARAWYCPDACAVAASGDARSILTNRRIAHVGRIALPPLSRLLPLA